MHLPHSARALWLLPLALAGCSSTLGSKFGGTPQSRSIAVVGDRPMPAATGEPGGRVVADVEEPEPRLNPRRRIAGKVIDEAGEPVAGATVRLADGAGKGGKEIRSTTDKTGSFTLNGLRPGSNYVLIAEAEDDHGPTLGRVEARTGEPDVEIAVVAEDAKPTIRKSARPAKARPVSSREDVEAENPPDREAPPRLNREDVAPPAQESESPDPGPPEPAPAGRPRLSPPEPGVGWKNSRAGSASASATSTTTASRPRDEEFEADPAPPVATSRRRRPLKDATPAGAEKGVNPLPPAIEPGGPDDPEADRPTSTRSASPDRVGAQAPTARESGEIALSAESSPDPAPKGDRRRSVSSAGVAPPASSASAAPVPDIDRPPTIIAPPVVEAEGGGPAPAAPPTMPPVGAASLLLASAEPPPPTTSPPDSPPINQDVARSNPAPQPDFALNAPVSKPAPVADYNPFANVSPSALGLDRVVEHPTEVAPGPDASPTPAEGPTNKKWGELSESAPPVAGPAPASPPSRMTLTAALLRRIRPPADPKEAPAASCSYDSRLRKLNDFRLPDLEGKPVRFQELDAEFVLLDFWGTWCEPCLDSIPHLVALQKKYGPDQLKVVGIACEEVAIDQRKAKVDAISRKLGINYPVLLSTMDGKPCPVQQALQVQAMPTMILVDRKGQVLWRNTGATPASESRLDRVLAQSVARGDSARR